MRVCVVSQEYPGVNEYYGGIGTQYRAFTGAWARTGTETHVITLAPDSGTAPASLDGVHVHALPRPRGWPWHGLLWSGRVARAVAEHGPFDAVLSPEFRGELFTYSKRQPAGPAITHLLTSSAQLLAMRPGLTWLERNGPRGRLFRELERRQAERSAALLAPGHAVLDWARELWPGIAALPAEILPLSIRVGEVRSAAEGGALPAGFPVGRGPTVTLPSRLDGHKGAQQLVDAMQIVWRRHPDAQLVFVGRDARYGHGKMSDHLRERAGGRAGHVHTLGGQPADRYFAAVAASDIVAIPSLWESFCLAAVEAMALRRPVIGTSGHGFSEYLREDENGLLVERGTVEPLAAAVERLLDDEQLRLRMGEAAARTADGLDVEAVAPRYVEALGRLAA